MILWFWWVSIWYGIWGLYFYSSLTSNEFIWNAFALIADIHFIFNQNSVLSTTEWRLKSKWMHIEGYWILDTEHFIWWRLFLFFFQFNRSSVDRKKKWKIELITTTTTKWILFESVESTHTQTLRALLTIQSESIQQTASATTEWEKINAKNIFDTFDYKDGWVDGLCWELLKSINWTLERLLHDANEHVESWNHHRIDWNWTFFFLFHYSKSHW